MLFKQQQMTRHVICQENHLCLINTTYYFLLGHYEMNISLKITVFLFISICNGQIKINKKPILEIMGKLLHEIIPKMNVNCVVSIIDYGSEYEWQMSTSAHIVTTSSDFMAEILEHTFNFNCQGYIVQIEDPIIFLEVWEQRRSEDLRRHSPKMLFLPWNNISYANSLFNSEYAQYLPDLIAIQVLENGPTENDVIFEILTNNFYDEGNQLPILLGTWPNNLSIDWFPDKIQDLKGKILKVATLEYPPYTQFIPFDGMEVRLVDTFCQHYNCSLITVADDDLWGELWSNNSGNGIVGNVYTGKADIGIGAVYTWYNEYQKLEFSYPYLNTHVTVLVPKPTQLPEWSIPLIAFSPAMWVAFITCIAVTALILFIINKYSIKIAPMSNIQPMSEFKTFSGILMRSVGMALLQPPGGRFASGSALQRFFTLFEILFLMFTTVYSGALSSVLTIPSYYPPIDTPMELYKSGLTWMADHEAWVYSLKEATEPHLQGLVQRFEPHETKDLIAYAKKGGYGFSIEIMPAGHVTHTAHLSGEMISGLHVMKKELYSTPVTTVFRKGSPYIEKYDWLIHRSLDAGFFKAWETISAVKYLSSRLQTALELSQSSSLELHPPVKLRLNHIQGAFILLSIGSIGSLLIFLMEIYLHKKEFSVIILSQEKMA